MHCNGLFAHGRRSETSHLFLLCRADFFYTPNTPRLGLSRLPHPPIRDILVYYSKEGAGPRHGPLQAPKQAAARAAVANSYPAWGVGLPQRGTTPLLRIRLRIWFMSRCSADWKQKAVSVQNLLHKSLLSCT